MASKHGVYHPIKIMCETTFGHGDSTTKIWAECSTCNLGTEPIYQYGFPATYDNMREAQSKLEYATNNSPIKH